MFLLISLSLKLFYLRLLYCTLHSVFSEKSFYTKEMKRKKKYCRKLSAFCYYQQTNQWCSTCIVPIHITGAAQSCKNWVGKTLNFGNIYSRYIQVAWILQFWGICEKLGVQLPTLKPSSAAPAVRKRERFILCKQVSKNLSLLITTFGQQQKRQL